MRQPLFSEVINLANMSRTTHIDPNPIREEKGWSLYGGEHRAHTSTMPFKVILFSSKAKADAIGSAAAIFEPGNTHVVYPPTLLKKQASLREAFGLRTEHFWTTTEYVRSFIKDELEAYLSKLPPAHSDYIDPCLDTPSGLHRKIPNPLRSFLLDPEDHVTPHGVAVTLAEAGQGKTYMCQHLVSEVVDSGETVIPLFIESKQWQSLSVDSLSSIWKTLTHCLRYYDAPIGWIEGNEEEFLKITLRVGLFRIIFDGFDEYVLQNRNISAEETFDTIRDLAQETGTRIIITSRTSFWDSLKPSADLSDSDNVYIYDLLPFDPNHANNYFKQTLRAQSEVDQANRVYLELRQESSDFAGRGFVLNLVRDLVSRSAGVVSTSEGECTKLYWLLERLCERETVRQELPLSYEEQMDVLTEYALMQFRAEGSTTDDLHLCIELAREDMAEEEIEKAIGSMSSSHPLLRKTGPTDEWAFTHDQIATTLVARRVLSLAPEDFASMAGNLKIANAGRSDLAKAIVDILALDETGHSLDEYARTLAQAITSKLSPVSLSEYLDRVDVQLLTEIILCAVNRLVPKGAVRKDRTTKLLWYLGADEVRGLAFNTSISGYDFRGVTFGYCRFGGNLLVNNEFDENTVFKCCKFIGGHASKHSSHIGMSHFEDCRFDSSAREWQRNEQLREGTKSYTSQDLKTDIRNLMARFVVKGGSVFKGLNREHLLRGKLSVSLHREEIGNVMLHHVLEEFPLSGSSGKGVAVREEAQEDVRFYTQNNVMTGCLGDAYRALCTKLKLE